MRARCRCWKNAFWLVTLLYPRCSMTALEMFSYSDLDIGRCAQSHACAAPSALAYACAGPMKVSLGLLGAVESSAGYVHTCMRMQFLQQDQMTYGRS